MAKPSDKSSDKPHRIGPPSVAMHDLHAPHDEDDHEEHPDERWLVSYADMMTLLFGLFVLLFSMANMDPKSAAAAQNAARKSFVTPDEEEKKEEVEEKIDQTPVLQKRLQDLEAELKMNQQKIRDAQVVQEDLKLLSEQLVKKDVVISQLELQVKNATPAPAEPRLQALLAEREREIERLISKKSELTRKVASVNADSEALILKDEEKQKLQDQIEELKQKMKKDAEADKGGRGQEFMAFFINWASKDHDVDLVIQDPRGKVFDFKHREHSGHPGLFALDTRRGPGVELWQSKNILPGRYKATYSLYNDYGNPENAPVNAVILTPKGSFEIALKQLDTKSNRKATVEFEVDKSGSVRIVSK